MLELSRLDRDVLLAAARGYTTDDIARELNLKAWTVRNRIARAYRLYGLRNRVELMRWMMAREGVGVVLEGARLEGSR